MPILNLNHVSLYYEEFGRGDRYLIQAQQFVNSLSLIHILSPLLPPSSSVSMFPGRIWGPPWDFS